MAKKFVRGITDIKTINNQDFDTNNVNDLLSDGEYNYIHRKKKDKSEEYHNLTDNIKTISSDNTDLLSVTNYNKSNNTATLHPHHDAQKEQVLESTRNTITIHHAENGTTETTKVDTNPEKVLEHGNLVSNSDYVKVTHINGEETTLIDAEEISEKFDTVDSSLSSKENKLRSLTNTLMLVDQSEHGETLIDVNATKVALIDNIHAGNNVSVTKSGNVVTISASGGLTPQHQSYGKRGTGYYVFKEIFGMRTTYTVEVVQGEPELTVVGDLKTDLVSKLANVSTLTNGAITLTYDGTNVKIITNESPANGVEQATFTFYNM